MARPVGGQVIPGLNVAPAKGLFSACGAGLAVIWRVAAEEAGLIVAFALDCDHRKRHVAHDVI